MNEIRDRLFELRDEGYAVFQARLTPTVSPDTIIGVRVPLLRQLAKDFANDPRHEPFMLSLPHLYYDENMLHGLLISELKDYDACVKALDSFLPYVDNWAVCDCMSPKVFRKHKKQLLEKIRIWAASDKTYTCRFGLEMLMRHFLDKDFSPEYLQIAAASKGGDYYVRMMVAWFFATALTKQWVDAIPYLETKTLSKWTHNKAIQKACESFRISKPQKEYLKTLKLHASH